MSLVGSVENEPPDIVLAEAPLHDESMTTAAQSSLEEAASADSSFALQGSPFHAGKTGHLPTEESLIHNAQQERCAAAREDLDAAVGSHRLISVHAALREGRAAGLDPEELAPAEALLHEEETKVGARLQLEDALNSNDA